MCTHVDWKFLFSLVAYVFKLIIFVQRWIKRENEKYKILFSLFTCSFKHGHWFISHKSLHFSVYNNNTNPSVYSHKSTSANAFAMNSQSAKKGYRSFTIYFSVFSLKEKPKIRMLIYIHLILFFFIFVFKILCFLFIRSIVQRIESSALI